MGTLIRLLGDSTKSTKEIDNVFKQPILVTAQSKVSMVGANVILADDVQNERFPVDSTDSIQVYPKPETDPVTVNIPDGNYSAHEMLQLYSDYVNYNAPTSATSIDNYIGLHAHLDVFDSKMRLQVFAGIPYEDAEFDEWHDIGDGTATVTATAFTANGIASSEILSPWQVPMMGSQFNCTLTNPDTIDITIAAVDAIGGNTELYGLRAESGQYQYAVWGTWINLGVAAAAGQTIQIQRYKDTVVYTIAGTDYSRPGPTINQFGDAPNLQWYVFGGANAALTAATCTQIEGITTLTRNPTKLKNNNVSMLLRLGSKTLATYFGFSDVGPYSFVGNPATIAGRTEMKGPLKYPGILVVLDNIGILPSHDGAAPETGQYRNSENILYVFHDLKNLGQTLSTDVPERIPLALNNSQPININRLRVRLLEAGGGNILDFKGNPCVTILIEPN